MSGVATPDKRENTLTRRALEADELVVGEGVVHRLGEGRGLVLARQTYLGVGAAAVVEGDHAAVVVGVAVGADAEGVGHRAGDADQEAAAAAGVGGGLGDRGLGAAVAVEPALGGEVAALQREGTIAYNDVPVSASVL